MEQDDDVRCMANGCCCCYNGCDCNTVVCLCMTSGDCLCIRQAACLSFNGTPRGCGFVTEKENNEICKFACLCLDIGLVRPTKICACACQYFCCYHVASFPWSKLYVDQPVCSLCYIQCFPFCGCCVSPPDCPALDKIQSGELFLPPDPSVMDRQIDSAGPPGTSKVREARNDDGSIVVKTTTVKSNGILTISEKVTSP
jgi:hypothetical protein